MRIVESHASGSSIIINSWKTTGIFEAIKMDSTELPSLDTFWDIFPLPVPSIDLSTPSPQVVPNELCVYFINDREDDSEYGSEYGKDDDSTDFTRNAFDILIVDENGDI